MDLDTFLSNIFGGVNDASTQGVAVLCAADDGFRARRWRKGHAPQGEQTYFCVSTVRDQPRQRVLSRKSEDLVLSWVAVLDDVGTKVDPALIRLAPSYKLETSSGNQQWGFKFTYPIAPEQYAALMQAIADAGLTDTGAIRADRVMRVPGSINVKREPFTARLVEENWDRAYSWTDLAIGLGVTVGDARPASVAPELGAGETDPTFDWLQASGRVIAGPNPRGWYATHCPWEASHSGEVDHGTDYRPGKPGAFKCLHGHCADRTTADLRAYATSEGADLRQVRPEARAALADLLRPHRAAYGGLPPAEGPPAGTGLAGRLAAHIRGIALHPSMLPDPDETPAGNVNMRQATTEARVAHVMELIGVAAQLNVVTQEIEATLAGFGEMLSSEDVISLLHHACVRCGMREREAVREGLTRAAQQSKYSPVLNWIASKAWDGRDRLKELCDSITMRNPTLNRWRDIALRRWFLQCIVAWHNYEREDPQQVGQCVVLQGDQGIGKSRWCKALLPAGWVTDGMSLKLDSGERDSVKRATRTPITELGEIDSTYRKSDTAALRNFLTTTMDTYRMPYGRTETSTARITVFIATVNPEGFLVDQTGERRFLPLAVERCNPAHGIDMQQLWAQVSSIEETHWLTEEEAKLHAVVARDHKQTSELTHVIEDIEVRAEAFEERSHLTPHEILTRYSIRPSPKLYGDLTASLAHAGYNMKTIKGRRGYYLPSLTSPLSTTQLAGLKLLPGSK